MTDAIRTFWPLLWNGPNFWAAVGLLAMMELWCALMPAAKYTGRGKW